MNPFQSSQVGESFFNSSKCIRYWFCAGFLFIRVIAWCQMFMDCFWQLEIDVECFNQQEKKRYQSRSGIWIYAKSFCCYRMKLAEIHRRKPRTNSRSQCECYCKSYSNQSLIYTPFSLCIVIKLYLLLLTKCLDLFSGSVTSEMIAILS